MIAVITVLVVAVAAARRWFTLAVVRGRSMAPTLADGQRVLAVRHRRYRVGDIVVFRPPGEPDGPEDLRWRIKRVAAIGGEPRPRVFDGQPLAMVVPAGHLALVGDSARSQDSRHFGYVPASRVAGRLVGRNPAGRSACGPR